ncbi:hypothetical protein AVEN_246360-1 [Araneus ventricosus]|uniref:Uncharacterized protein n=1 Tax=Araneus ventricosus TaxID=182803 RepID=A0A4Y2Q3J9_ARAVE|nr:hypothetical protein AVEN_246360-1 [Araneus ventricosus]
METFIETDTTLFQLPLNIRTTSIEARVTNETNFCNRCRRNTPLESGARCWRNVVLSDTFSNADRRTYDSRREQYRDLRRYGQTPPGGTAAAVVCAVRRNDEQCHGATQCQHEASRAFSLG